MLTAPFVAIVLIIVIVLVRKRPPMPPAIVCTLVPIYPEREHTNDNRAS